MTIEAEVLIVGGGIAGASAAFHLAGHGRACRPARTGRDRVRRLGRERGRHRLDRLG